MAIGGKVLRGAIMDASKQSALHPVQAFEPGAGLVLGQMKVDGKSNETATIPGLLEILDLAGRTAAADAMRTQREASARIMEKGGDCVLPTERNQKTLHEDVQVWFADPVARKEMLSCLHVGGGHGRIETRIAMVSHDVGWLRERHDWPGLKAVGRIEAIRERKGKEERSVRHFIMSAEIPPERLFELVCNRWAIENDLHWVLGVVMDEDRMRNQTLNGPESINRTHLTLRSVLWRPAAGWPKAPPNPTIRESAVEATDSRGRSGNRSPESLSSGLRGRSSCRGCSETEP